MNEKKEYFIWDVPTDFCLMEADGFEVVEGRINLYNWTEIDGIKVKDIIASYSSERSICLNRIIPTNTDELPILP